MTTKSIIESRLFPVGVPCYAEGFPLGVFYGILPDCHSQIGYTPLTMEYGL